MANDLTVTFPLHLETSPGVETTWNITAELYREHGRYWFDSFEAHAEDADLGHFDSETDFAAYCLATDGSEPDLVSLACDALEAQSDDASEREAERGE